MRTSPLIIPPLLSYNKDTRVYTTIKTAVEELNRIRGVYGKVDKEIPIPTEALNKAVLDHLRGNPKATRETLFKTINNIFGPYRRGDTVKALWNRYKHLRTEQSYN